MIVLAYDGSINGDWVARYAMRLAAQQPDRTLTLVHVRTREVEAEVLDAKLRHIQTECAELGVRLEVDVAPPQGSVFATLAARIPAGAGTFVVCGARLRGGRGGYLSGTVSERLLKHPAFNVMAVHCAKPGLLGDPHEILWPLRGHPDEVRAGIPFLGLFAPRLHRLCLLRVVTVGRLAFRRLRPARVDELRAIGQQFLERIEAGLAQDAGLEAGAVYADVRIADDREQEIVLAASRHKSQLILLWAPDDSLKGGFFFGNPLEQIIGNAPCDVAVYRGAE